MTLFFGKNEPELFKKVNNSGLQNDTNDIKPFVH